MSFNGNTYGSLSPRIGMYAVAKLLATAQPQLVLDKFGQHVTLPKNHGMVIKFRRPVTFNPATTELVEGVTPPPEIFEYEDVAVRIRQYGAYVVFTDVVANLHEDDVPKHIVKQLSEQVATTRESITWSVLTAGTSVFYSGTATSRATVQAPITLNDINRAIRTLEKNFAKKITDFILPTVGVSTQAIRPAYILFGHTDLRQDFEAMTGYIPLENYSKHDKVSDYEIGSVRGVRIVLTPHYAPLKGAGASPAPPGVLSSGGAVDVYQCVIVGADAYGCVGLHNRHDAEVALKMPKIGESIEDPLGLRGFAAWKMWYACVRLNEAWMTRIECAASAL